MAMIEFKTGDILRADAEALVNTVNCVGIMGRGIALQFKNDFPDNFKAYEAACARDEVQPGRMFVFETGTLTNPKFIINFPTKRHWRGKSRIEDIESGLEGTCRRDPQSRHPLDRHSAARQRSRRAELGRCSLRASRRPCAASMMLNVIVFEPNSAPAATKSREVPNMTPGRRRLLP